MSHSIEPGNLPTSSETATSELSSHRFRLVLGRFPTGVTVIAARSVDGEPVGLAVGSFTSVSLDPPLVAFFPAKSSTTFPAIREAGSFCVNVLSADQASVCAAFSTRGADKFGGIAWDAAPCTQSPRLVESIAWIDCDIESVTEAGDHYVVLGRVRALGVHPDDRLPLVFFQGGYGRFESSSLAAWDRGEFLRPLRVLTLGQELLEALADEFEMEVLALVRADAEMIVLASSGASRISGLPSRVGHRLPVFPPMGAAFYAFDPDAEEEWQALAAEQSLTLDEADGLLTRVKDRGYSLGLGSDRQVELDDASAAVPLTHTPHERRAALESFGRSIGRDDTEPESVPQPGDTTPVRSIAVPVLDSDGNLLFVISAYAYRTFDYQNFVRVRTRLLSAAAEFTGLSTRVDPIS